MENGFLNVLKPPGMTSFDVIRLLQESFPKEKFGHSGTLDLPACGVLAIARNRATRFLPYLPTDKEYIFDVVFGIETDTGDIWGNILKEGRGEITLDEIERVIVQFSGTVKQETPLYSAKHWRGERLYQMALRGETASEIIQAPVEIFSLKLLNFTPGKLSRARFLIHCSAGTYIRFIAQKLGRLLESAACAHFIVRVRSGNFHLQHSQLITELKSGYLKWIELDEALSHLPLIVLADRQLRAFYNGQVFPQDNSDSALLFRARDRRGNFLGVLGRKESHLLKAERILR